MSTNIVLHGHTFYICHTPQTANHTVLCGPLALTASHCCCPADIPTASLKMLDWLGEGESSNIVLACAWLLQTSMDGVNPNPDNVTNAAMLGVEAINMSFGFNGNPYGSTGLQVCKVMDQLRQEGIIMAAAAGENEVPLCLNPFKK